MGKKPEASLFERFIIMLMGLGVLLVGASPLTKEHGGIFKYLKSKGIEVGGLESYIDSASKRARLKYKEVVAESVKVDRREEKSLDAITKNDKEELDKLLDEVVK